MSENSYMGQLVYKRILTKYKLTFHSDKDKVLKENLKRGQVNKTYILKKENKY